jgi:hypothetical protein
VGAAMMCCLLRRSLEVEMLGTHASISACKAHMHECLSDGCPPCIDPLSAAEHPFRHAPGDSDIVPRRHDAHLTCCGVIPCAFRLRLKCKPFSSSTHPSHLQS